MKKLPFFIVALLWYNAITAQNSLKRFGKLFDSSDFANDDTLTHSDYLSRISKTFQILNEATLVGQFIPYIDAIVQQMDEDDSALSIIKSKAYCT